MRKEQENYLHKYGSAYTIQEYPLSDFLSEFPEVRSTIRPREEQEWVDMLLFEESAQNHSWN